MKTVILVPRRADNGHRDRLWQFAQVHWENLGFAIYEGDHTEGPFNRSAAVNRAAELAGTWDSAIIIDSDVLVDLARVKDGMVYSDEMSRIVFPFRTYQALNAGMTEMIMDGYHGSWTKGIRATFYDNRSACEIVPRSVWESVGGFDERFIGWGWEDVGFIHYSDALNGNHLRLVGDLWHLWHHRSPENNHASPLFLANRDLAHRYLEARFSPAETVAILSEPGGPLA